MSGEDGIEGDMKRVEGLLERCVDGTGTYLENTMDAIKYLPGTLIRALVQMRRIDDKLLRFNRELERARKEALEAAESGTVKTASLVEEVRRLESHAYEFCIEKIEIAKECRLFVRDERSSPDSADSAQIRDYELRVADDCEQFEDEIGPDMMDFEGDHLSSSDDDNGSFIAPSGYRNRRGSIEPVSRPGTGSRALSSSADVFDFVTGSALLPLAVQPFDLRSLSPPSNLGESHFPDDISIEPEPRGVREGRGKAFCFCRMPSFGQMVGCDGDHCRYEWFHFRCVGLTHAPVGKWFCSDCLSREGNFEAH